MSSEQDKRVVYMGNFERFKKETHVKHADLLEQLVMHKKVLKTVVITTAVSSLLSIVALAI
jgi:hypothetical protein